MNYIKITPCDIANGPGVRVTLWVAGCNHHCKGCHNPQTWSPSAGQRFSDDTLKEILELLKPDYIRGLTLSGGDPLYPRNRPDILTLIEQVREVYGNTKDIWLWTGYPWEDIQEQHITDLCDVVVDGEFIEEQKDISLPYCGSRNQRVIDCKKSLDAGKIVLWEEK